MIIDLSLVKRILIWTTPWAVPSIITIVIFVLKRKATQRRLSIYLDRVDYSGRSEPEIRINIINVGNVNVTINNIELSTDNFNFPINYLSRPYQFLPYELSTGSDCFSVVYINIKLAKNLIQNGYSGKIKLVAIITDGAGKTYRSKKSIIFNLNEYSKA